LEKKTQKETCRKAVAAAATTVKESGTKRALNGRKKKGAVAERENIKEE